MDKIKVFLCVPMAGKDDEAIGYSFEMLKNCYLSRYPYKKDCVEFVYLHEPKVYTDDPECRLKKISYIGKAVEMLADCDMMVVHPTSWMISTGCAVFKKICEDFNIHIMEV